MRRAARLLRLPPEKVPVVEPVTALGLDSLAAVELAHELESSFSVAPSLAELLAGPSLEMLAAERGLDMKELDLARLDALWDEAKAGEATK